MSYILDALKRAERERKQGQVSVLDEIPAAQPAVATRRRLTQGWPPIVAGAAVLALLIYALLAWKHRHGQEAGGAATATRTAPVTGAAPQPAPPAPPQPRLSAVAPVAAPPEAPPPAPAATIEDGGRIATLDDVYGQPPPASPGPGAAPPPPAPAAAVRPPPGPPPAEESGAFRRLPRPPVVTIPPRDMSPPSSPAAAVPAPPPAAPVDAAAAAPAAAEAPAPAEAVSQPPPSPAAPPVQDQPPADQQALREMPESYRANFPAFSVDVHAYNSSPQRRFVLVNGKRYHEGDTLAEGPRIVAIVPEGMVLEWQGQRVLYAIAH